MTYKGFEIRGLHTSYLYLSVLVRQPGKQRSDKK